MTLTFTNRPIRIVGGSPFAPSLQGRMPPVGHRQDVVDWPCTAGKGGEPRLPPPLPPDRNGHRGKQPNLLLEKSGGAIFGTQIFGSPPPLPPCIVILPGP